MGLIMNYAEAKSEIERITQAINALGIELMDVRNAYAAEHAPFQPGDIIWFRRDSVQARVVSVIWHDSFGFIWHDSFDFRGEGAFSYRCTLILKDGSDGKPIKCGWYDNPRATEQVDHEN